MKRSNLLIVISIIFNMVLSVFVVNYELRITALEDRLGKGQVVKESILEKNETKEDLYKINYIESFKELEERLSDCEADMRTEQRLALMETSIERLEDLIFRQGNINIGYGVIRGIEANDTISFKVRPFKLLRGNEAIKELMDKDKIKREEAEARIQEHGYTFIDLGVDHITLEIDNDCKVYFISEIGLVKANFEELVEKVKTEAEENFQDEYTFVLIDNKVVQVYQSYLP